MYLKKIHLLNFKNYEDSEFSFDYGVNCITGANGKGKTNLLDAIHYLCFSKSFLNPTDSQNILHDAPFFMIEGNFFRFDSDELIYCGLKRGQKKQLKRNKKEYERLSEHIGLFPLVVISPLDSVLITGGSEERRKFTDSLIAQFNKPYLEHLINYNRILYQRNALLKQMAETRKVQSETLDILDEQLVAEGNEVFNTRSLFINEFVHLFNKYYQKISDSEEIAGLEYQSQLLDTDFETLIKKYREKDLRFQYTTIGTHKDDLELLLNTYPVKRFGSQGQQKTYLAALKLAEHEYLSIKTGIRPILLLDDIFDKMDDQRVGRLVSIVGKKDFGQIFITDTGNQHISDVFHNFGVHASFIEL